MVFLKKIEMINEEEKKKKMKILKKVSQDVFAVSILDDRSVKELGEHLTQTFK